MEQRIVRFMNMPSFCGGFTTVDENGDYNIYINQNLCPKKIEEVIKHEIRHITNNDFYEYKDITLAEKKANEPTDINLEDALFA
jgi:hypothetical protein